jgi:O-antigen ligase
MLLGVALFSFLIKGSSRLGGEIGPFATTSLCIVLMAVVSLAGPANGNTHEGKNRGSVAWVKGLFLALLTYMFLRQLAGGGSELVNMLPVIFYASVGLVASRLAQRSPTTLFTVMTAAALAHVGIALVEVLLGHTLFYGSWKLIDAQYIGGFVRVASTTADPNYLALTLALLAPFCWERMKRWPRSAVAVVAIGYAIALILTFSRSLYLGTAVVILLAVVNRRSHKGLVPAVLLSAAATALMALFLPRVVTTVVSRFTSTFAGGGDASTTSRTLTQEHAWYLSQDHPLFGHGYGAAPTLLHSFANALVPLDAAGKPAFLAQTSVLNTYLLTLLEGGLVGLVLAGGLFVAILGVVRSAGLFQAAWVLGLVMFLFLDVPSFGPVWAFGGAVYGLSIRGFFGRPHAIAPTSITDSQRRTAS